MSRSTSAASQAPPPARLILVRRGSEPELSDADLARALVRGDARAPFLAWTRFTPLVRSTLRRLLGPITDEDDLKQEVFLRFFRRVRDLREPEAVRSFLFGICLRVSRKEVRRRWLRRWLRLTERGAVPDVASSGDSDEAAGDVRDAVARYHRLLDAVGGQGRSLFVTRHIEGLELAEVARLHGLSVSTAQRRLARVAKRLEAMVRGDPVLAEMAGRGG
jgi:RNA polymerase sigma-70 factor (ECF subfamily)